MKFLNTVVHHLTLSALLVSSLAACAPTNSDLMAPPETPQSRSKISPTSEVVSMTQKVDILFVIDNSWSMDPHQAELRKNINQFVTAFANNANVDFHIGVTAIWDDRRYGVVIPEPFKRGELFALKDPCRPGAPLPGPRFITRSTGGDMPTCASHTSSHPYTRVLGETLFIGTKERGDLKNDKGGPEFEAVFSPIVDAIRPEVNPGFVRDDAHLAIIMLTDSNDKSDISADDLYRAVLARKGGNAKLVSFYGILTEDPALKNVCGPDKLDHKGERPARITQFLTQYSGRYFSLCDRDYGKELSKIGTVIHKLAAPAFEMKLDGIPEENPNTFWVACVDPGQDLGYAAKACDRNAPVEPNLPAKCIERNASTGWSYAPESRAISIRSDVRIPCKPGAQIVVNFRSVNPAKIGTKHVLPATGGVQPAAPVKQPAKPAAQPAATRTK